MNRLPALLLAAAALLPAGIPAPRADEPARIVKVVDGDTLEVRLMDGSNRSERVRLIGVDAAELRGDQPFARQARDYLRILTGGERVDLVSDKGCQDRDKYGRLLRYVVLLYGLDVNAELIRTGHARVYAGAPFSRLDAYLKLEAEACRRGIGGWGATGAGWGICDKGAPGKGRASAGGERVVYLSRRGSRYHTADCPTLKGMGMMIPLAQALARGMKPCKICSPPGPPAPQRPSRP